MTFQELLPVVHSLTREEKLRLMRVLVDDLTEEEDVPRLDEGTTHTIWSPYDAHEAADTLLKVLHEKSSDAL